MAPSTRSGGGSSYDIAGWIRVCLLAAAQIGGSGACIVVVQPSPAPSPLESKLALASTARPRNRGCLPAACLLEGLHCIALL